MKYLKILCLSVFSLSAFSVGAQEQLGLRLENFSGNRAVFLNPASTVSMPMKWDVNVASAGIFAENNYGLLQDASLSAVWRQRENFMLIAADDVTSETTLTPSTFIGDYNRDGRRRYLSALAVINGPSVLLRLREEHTAGLFYNFRFGFGSANVPTTLSYYDYFNRDFFDPFPVAPFDGVAMAWEEVGFHYSYRYETAEGWFAMGANVKNLRGKEAAFFENVNPIVLTKTGQDSLTTDLAVFEYGLTTASLDQSGYAHQTLGRGVGIDAGISATFGGFKDEGYNIKLGLAVIDIGRINFNRSTQKHRSEVNQTTTVAIDDFADLSSPDDYPILLRTFSQLTQGDSTATLIDDNFTIGLPTAVSIQADYSFNAQFYVNLTVVERISLGNINRLRRGNIIALTPRFEQRWLAAQVPLVFYDNRKTRVGLSFRLAYLTVGTDNIGSLFGRFSDLTGTDFYVGLKINPATLATGDRYENPGRLRKKRKRVRCYFF